MNTEQKNKLNMQLTVRNCITLNEAVAKTIPKFMENYSILLSTTTEIQEISKLQGTDKTGVASDKNKLKKTLIAMAAKNSRKVAALAKFINSDKLLNEVRYNEAQLGRFAETTLIEKAMLIYSNAEENIGKLAEHGITPETQKVFFETITALNDVLKTPRATIAERKKSTERLTVLFETADEALEMMDFAVGIVKDEQVDFVTAYKTARKLIDKTNGNVSLKARATDAITGTPVSGALFTFNHEHINMELSTGNGRMTKKTASKGSFHIRNMQPGTYKVVSKKNRI